MGGLDKASPKVGTRQDRVGLVLKGGIRRQPKGAFDVETVGQDRRRGRHKRRDTVHFGRTKNGICAGGSVLNSFDESRVSKVVSCSKYEEKEKQFLLLFENTNLKDLVEEVIVFGE